MNRNLGEGWVEIVGHMCHLFCAHVERGATAGGACKEGDAPTGGGMHKAGALIRPVHCWPCKTLILLILRLSHMPWHSQALADFSALWPTWAFLSITSIL